MPNFAQEFYVIFVWLVINKLVTGNMPEWGEQLKISLIRNYSLELKRKQGILYNVSLCMCIYKGNAEIL